MPHEASFVHPDELRAHGSLASMRRSAVDPFLLQASFRERPRADGPVSPEVRGILEPHVGGLPDDLTLRTGASVDRTLEQHDAYGLAWRNEVWVGSPALVPGTGRFASVLVHEAAHVASGASFSTSPPLWGRGDAMIDPLFEEDRRRAEALEASETGANRPAVLARLGEASDVEARRIAPGIAYRAQARGDVELALAAARRLLDAWLAQRTFRPQLDAWGTQDDGIDRLLDQGELAFRRGHDPLGAMLLTVAMVQLVRAAEAERPTPPTGVAVVDAMLALPSPMAPMIRYRIDRARALLQQRGEAAVAAGTAEALADFARLSQLVQNGELAAGAPIPDDFGVPLPELPEQPRRRSAPSRAPAAPQVQQPLDPDVHYSRAAEQVVSRPPDFEGALVLVSTAPTQYVVVRSPRYGVAGTVMGARLLGQQLFGQRASVIAQDERAIARNEIRYVVAALSHRLDVSVPENVPEGAFFEPTTLRDMTERPGASGWSFLSVVAGPVDYFRTERAGDFRTLVEREAEVPTSTLSDAERRSAIFGAIDEAIRRERYQEAADALVLVGADGFALVDGDAKARYVNALLEATTLLAHERTVLEIFASLRSEQELAGILSYLARTGQLHSLHADLESTFFELTMRLGVRFPGGASVRSTILPQLRIAEYGPIEVAADGSLRMGLSAQQRLVNAVEALLSTIAGAVVGMVDLVAHPDEVAKGIGQILYFALMLDLASKGYPPAIRYTSDVVSAFLQALGRALSGAAVLQRNVPEGTDFLRDYQDAVEWRVLWEIAGLFVGATEALAVLDSLRSGRAIGAISRMLRVGSTARRTSAVLSETSALRYARLARALDGGTTTEARIARTIAGLPEEEQLRLARAIGEADDVTQLSAEAQERLRAAAERARHGVDDAARAERALDEAGDAARTEAALADEAEAARAARAEASVGGAVAEPPLAASGDEARRVAAGTRGPHVYEPGRRPLHLDNLASRVRERLEGEASHHGGSSLRHVRVERTAEGAAGRTLRCELHVPSARGGPTDVRIDLQIRPDLSDVPGAHLEDGGPVRMFVDRNGEGWRAQILIHDQLREADVAAVVGHELDELAALLERHETSGPHLELDQEARLFRPGSDLDAGASAHDVASVRELMRHLDELRGANGPAAALKRERLGRLLEAMGLDVREPARIEALARLMDEIGIDPARAEEAIREVTRVRNDLLGRRGEEARRAAEALDEERALTQALDGVAVGPTFRSDLADHVRFRDEAVRGEIGGAHDVNEFMRYADEFGIGSRQPHASIPGVEVIRYRMRQRGPDGSIIPEFQNDFFTKTVYDPSIIPHDRMLRWGREAAAEAMSRGVLTREWTGRTVDGILMHGFLDGGGRVASFYPL